VRRPASVRDRLAVFAHRELSADSDRTRAFGRTLVGVILASAVALTFRPDNGYWIVTFVLLVSSPAVGKSERDALRRVVASLVGGTAAALVVIGAYDLPWAYVPLQAAGLGLALFLGRATPLGSPALTGGTAFAVITAAAHEAGPAGVAQLIDLAWDRVLLAVLGCGFGALAQLVVWPADPVDDLRRALATQLSAVDGYLRGERTSLDAGRVGRHFELLAHAFEQYPALERHSAHLSLLILDVACLVDRALGRDRLAGRPTALLEAVLVQLRRCGDASTFEPPPAPPPPSRPARWPSFLADGVRLQRHAALKTALAALLALIVLETIRFPAAGGLLACLLVGLGVSTGTDSSKVLTLVGGQVLGMLVLLVESRLFAPNVDDLGSYLVVAALSFAPVTWAFVAGARVRIPGQLAVVLVAVGLFQAYQPSDDLGPAVNFFVAVSIGCLIMGGVDRVVWPIQRDLVVLHEVVSTMRAAADVLDERDPRVVLAPGHDPRWLMHTTIRAIAALRGETAPVPGTPAFQRDEETLRLATEALRLVVERLEDARREIERGATVAGAEERYESWAAFLRARADRIELLGDVLVR
jgi:uncharacterized membrane protein YccC